MKIEKGKVYRANNSVNIELPAYHDNTLEEVKTDNRYPHETVRIIEKALKHDDEGVKAYTRKLADFYRKEGKDNIADNILSYIGEAKVGMTTMDETDQESGSKYGIFTVVPFKIKTMSYLDAQAERLQGLKSLREKLYKLTLEWYEWELADHPTLQKKREEKLKDLYIQFHYRMQDHEQFMWDFEKHWDLNYQDYGLKKVYDSTINDN